MVKNKAVAKSQTPNKAVHAVTKAQDTPKVYPFHTPLIFPPDWEMQMADISTNYALLQHGKACSLETLKDDHSSPVVFISKPIYEGLHEMAKYAYAKKKSEVACYCVYKKLNPYKPHWEIFGMFLTGQEVHAAEASMEGSDFPPYLEHLKTSYPEEFSAWDIAHVHSHPGGLSLHWSGTDKKQQHDLSQLGKLTGDRIVLLLDDKRGIKAKYIQYTPILFEMDDIAVGISFSNTDYDVKAFNTRLHAMIDELLEEKKSAWEPKGGNGFYAKNQRVINDMDDYMGGYLGYNHTDDADVIHLPYSAASTAQTPDEPADPQDQFPGMLLGLATTVWMEDTEAFDTAVVSLTKSLTLRLKEINASHRASGKNITTQRVSWLDLSIIKEVLDLYAPSMDFSTTHALRNAVDNIIESGCVPLTHYTVRDLCKNLMEHLLQMAALGIYAEESFLHMEDAEVTQDVSDLHSLGEIAVEPTVDTIYEAFEFLYSNKAISPFDTMKASEIFNTKMEA